MATKWCCCREHGVTENDVCSKCEMHGDDVIDFEALLQEAHDIMDDKNVVITRSTYCLWCTGTGYNGNGLIHDDSCILVRIRRVLS